MANRLCSLKPWRSAASRICCWTLNPAVKSEAMVARTGVTIARLRPPSSAWRPRPFDPAIPASFKRSPDLRRTEARQCLVAIWHNLKELVELGDDEHLVDLRLDVHEAQIAALELDLLIHVDQHPQRRRTQVIDVLKIQQQFRMVLGLDQRCQRLADFRDVRLIENLILDERDDLHVFVIGYVESMQGVMRWSRHVRLSHRSRCARTARRAATQRYTVQIGEKAVKQRHFERAPCYCSCSPSFLYYPIAPDRVFRFG